MLSHIRHACACVPLACRRIGGYILHTSSEALGVRGESRSASEFDTLSEARAAPVFGYEHHIVFINYQDLLSWSFS
jgi:hypothetical protein